jgi:hypothetical protein
VPDGWPSFSAGHSRRWLPQLPVWLTSGLRYGQIGDAAGRAARDSGRKRMGCMTRLNSSRAHLYRVISSKIVRTTPAGNPAR